LVAPQTIINISLFCTILKLHRGCQTKLLSNAKPTQQPTILQNAKPPLDACQQQNESAGCLTEQQSMLTIINVIMQQE